MFDFIFGMILLIIFCFLFNSVRKCIGIIAKAMSIANVHINAWEFSSSELVEEEMLHDMASRLHRLDEFKAKLKNDPEYKEKYNKLKSEFTAYKDD